MAFKANTSSLVCQIWDASDSQSTIISWYKIQRMPKEKFYNEYSCETCNMSSIPYQIDVMPFQLRIDK